MAAKITHVRNHVTPWGRPGPNRNRVLKPTVEHIPPPPASKPAPGLTDRAWRPGWRWLLVLLAGLLATAALLPFDGVITNYLHTLGGPDMDARLLRFTERWGNPLVTLVVAGMIFLFDRPKRLRLLDLAAAVGLTALLSLAVKMLVGRPRPKFEQPWTFLWPWGRFDLPPYPADDSAPLSIYAWDLFAESHGQLWSMPSSHTSAAMVLSTFIARCYPRTGWLMVALVAMVGLTRAVQDAHYPTDLVVGGLLGYLVTDMVINLRLGQKLGLRLARRLPAPLQPDSSPAA